MVYREFTEEDKEVINTMTPDMLALMSNTIDETLSYMLQDEDYFYDDIKVVKLNHGYVTEIALHKLAQRMIDDGRIKIDVPTITH